MSNLGLNLGVWWVQEKQSFGFKSNSDVSKFDRNPKQNNRQSINQSFELKKD